MHGILGVPFIAFAPFVGVAAGVYLFGKISMAQFNPAVTLGFLITRHITRIQLAYAQALFAPIGINLNHDQLMLIHEFNHDLRQFAGFPYH
jgi:hypothetical protein